MKTLTAVFLISLFAVACDDNSYHYELEEDAGVTDASPGESLDECEILYDEITNVTNDMCAICSLMHFSKCADYVTVLCPHPGFKMLYCDEDLD